MRAQGCTGFPISPNYVDYNAFEVEAALERIGSALNLMGRIL
jgi:hypothetical protein